MNYLIWVPAIFALSACQKRSTHLGCKVRYSGALERAEGRLLEQIKIKQRVIAVGGLGCVSADRSMHAHTVLRAKQDKDTISMQHGKNECRLYFSAICRQCCKRYLLV